MNRLTGRLLHSEFVEALRRAEPRARFIAYLGPVPLLMIITVWLATPRGLGFLSLAGWLVFFVVVTAVWVPAVRRDELPSAPISLTLHHLLVALQALVFPEVWFGHIVFASVTTGMLLALSHFRWAVVNAFGGAGVVLLVFAVNGNVDPFGWKLTLAIVIVDVFGSAVELAGNSRRSAALAHESLVSTQASSWQVTSDGVFKKVLGTNRPGVEPGGRLIDAIHPDDRALRPIPAQLSGVYEYRLVTEGPNDLWVRESVEARRLSSGTTVSGVVDITAVRRRDAELAHLVGHDELTGLANRRQFRNQLAEVLNSDSAGGDHALLLVDLDGFKELNDNLGHEIGDAVLERVARRLERVTGARNASRLGGDEFGVLIPPGLDIAASASVVTSGLGEPIALPGGITVSVGASVGSCVLHSDELLDELVRRADRAMYRAKATGGGWAPYEATLDDSHDGLDLSRRIRPAIEAGEIEMFHQAKVSAVTGEVVGSEALARWRHPEHGILTPDRFLPLIEVGGLLRIFTRQVLTQSLEALAAGPDHLTVAVNVDGRNLNEDDFVDSVLAQLDLNGIDPSRLWLELTEESLVEPTPTCTATLLALAEAGVRWSVDDFGTGYSSLAYLGRLPVSEIKLDRALVEGVVDRGRDRAIVDAVVGLAKSLEMSVTAEGVETEEQWKVLTDIGCDRIQGFLFARPEPHGEFLERVAKAVATTHP